MKRTFLSGLRFNTCYPTFHVMGLLGLLTCLTPQLSAQTWTGAVDGNWSNAGNWSTNAIPTSSQVATFNSNPSNPVLTLGGAHTIDGISFTSGATNGINLGTFNDYVLTLDGGAGTDINIQAGSGAHTIHSALNITGTHSWANASSNVFTAAGNVSFGTTALTFTNAGSGGWVLGSTDAIIRNNNAGDLTLTVGNSGAAKDLTLNGTVYITNSSTGRTFRIAPAADSIVDINAVLANGDGVTGTGGSGFLIGNTSGNTGTVNLNATKTYTGTTTINNGATLNVNAAITNVGTWDIDGGTVNWNVTNTNMGSLYLGGGGANTLSTVNIATDVTMNLGGSIITEHNSSQSGLATIQGGTLNLNNANRTIEVRPSSAVTRELTIHSVIADGSVSSGITKSRNGVLVFTADNTFTGATRINEGTLILDHTSNNGDKLSSTAAFTMGGGTLELIGNDTAHSAQVFTGTTLTTTGANLIKVIAGAGQTASIHLGSISRANNTGATLTVSANSPSASVRTGSSNTNGILGGWAYTQNSAGNYFARVNNEEITALSTEHYTDLNSQFENSLGSWQNGVNASDEAGFTGSNNNIDVNSLRISGANDLTIADTLNVHSGGILITENSTAKKITGGALTHGNASVNYELIFTQNSASDFEISSNIQRKNNALAGFLDITKAGAGTLILSGKNSTGASASPTSGSGTIRIAEGTLVASGGKAISDNTVVSLEARAGVTFQITNDETVGGIAGGGADGGTVAIGSNKLTLNFAASQTFSGYITGSGTLVKQLVSPGATSGTLNVTNASTGFTGSIVVNGGLFQLSGNNISHFSAVSSITVNKGGTLLIDLNDSSSGSGNRINDTAQIHLEGANGTHSSQTIFRGLSIRSNQNSSRQETVGNINLNRGANYATLESTYTNTGTSSHTSLIGSTLNRNNESTLAIRGHHLAANAGTRTQFRIATAGESAFVAANAIGGEGLAGSSELKIIPWIVAQNLGATTNTLITTSNVQNGNSLTTYATGLGFRALDFTSEYVTFSDAALYAGSALKNVRESLNASDASVSSSATVNGLVLDNANTTTARNLTGAGTGVSLKVNSGAILFTALDDSTFNALSANLAQGMTVSGFDAGITTETGEYIIFQNNLSTAGVTISSDLTSTAKLTKSGLGTLILSGNNSALTDVTLNEGVVQVSSLDNLGGANDKLVFAGGTLKLGAGFTGDLSSKNIVVLGNAENSGINGGRMGELDTNGINTVFNQTLSGSGEFLKSGSGHLTLKGTTSSTHTGTFVVEQTRSGTDQLGGVAQLILDNENGNAIGGNLQIGAYVTPSVNGSASVYLARSNQIVDTAVISFTGLASKYGYFSLRGFNETVAGIRDSSGNGLVQVEQLGTIANGSTITLSGAEDYYFNGFVRNRSSGTGGVLSLTHDGSGTQTLAGNNVRYTGNTINSNGLLRYRDTTNFDGNINNTSKLEFERITGSTEAWNYSGIISGSGDFYKTGESDQVTTLDANNTMTGAVVIQAGKLTLGTNGKIDDAKMLEVKSGASFETAAAGYTYFGKVSGSGTLIGNVTLSKKAGSVTSLAELLPGTSTQQSNTATAGNNLGNITFTGTLTLTGGTAVGDGTGAKATLQIAKATLNDSAGIANAIGLDTLNSYLLSQATASWNAASAIDAISGVTLHDTVNFTTAGLVWDKGSTITLDASSGYTPVFGDVIDLFDWSQALGGTADTGAVDNRRIGGLIGDLELPTLAAGLEYDLSAFASHGLIAVVGTIPEPSRVMFVFLGLLVLGARRRR